MKEKTVWKKKLQRKIWIERVNDLHISKTGTSICARKISSFSKTEEEKITDLIESN